MGGCATKPRGFDFKPEAAPSEAPTSPDKAEGQNIAQENNAEGGENEKKEAPLVDLSEPTEEKKEEASDAAAPAAEEDKPEEEKVDAKEEEAEAAAEPVKEEVKTETVQQDEKTSEASTSGAKSDEPLVTV